MTRNVEWITIGTERSFTLSIRQQQQFKYSIRLSVCLSVCAGTHTEHARSSIKYEVNWTYCNCIRRNSNKYIVHTVWFSRTEAIFSDSFEDIVYWVFKQLSSMTNWIWWNKGYAVSRNAQSFQSGEILSDQSWAKWLAPYHPIQPPEFFIVSISVSSSFYKFITIVQYLTITQVVEHFSLYLYGCVSERGLPY